MMKRQTKLFGLAAKCGCALLLALVSVSAMAFQPMQIPEPGTMSLIALVAAGVVGSRFWRKK